MTNILARLSITAGATILACLATSTVSTPARAEWTATDNDWTGCVATSVGGASLGVRAGYAAIGLGCGTPNVLGNFNVIGSTLVINGDRLVWTSLSASARTVAMGADGTPWIADGAGNIFWFDHTSAKWTSLAGCAISLGSGRSNSLWAIGCTNVSSDGNDIKTFNGSGWTSVAGAATQIAVAPEGTPWVLNARGFIYRWNGARFVGLPGCARSIGVGANDTAWVIGCDATATQGGTPYRWNGSGWTAVPGVLGMKVAVSESGEPWVVDAQGKIHAFNTPTVSTFKGGPTLAVTGYGWAGPLNVTVVYNGSAPSVPATVTPGLDGVFDATAALSLRCDATHAWSGTVYAYDATSLASTTVSCP